MAPVLKALGVIVTKAFATLASQTLLEWLLFKVADALVESTKTPHDDMFLKKFKEGYEQSK